jgi:hypothetical protein
VESDEHNAELQRLRGLFALMREHGSSELRVGDVHIKLDPIPREDRVVVSADPDEQAELSEEERRLQKMSKEEREHYKYWRRLTRSSGAPIPPFRPREQ